MSVFGAYSRYYNLFYKDKDDHGEAEYAHGLIQRFCLGAASILDLGCGTGRHDVLLAAKGYAITGVDRSEEMLAAARTRLANLEPRPSALDFIQGDIRSVRLGEKFDVVVSLFHVVSYQTANTDLHAMFATARAHLKPGGLFLFDCWYGPAVLTERPSVRVKRLEDEEIEVVRIAEPLIQFNQNCVDVNYHVLVTEKASGRVEQIRETHRMRYLFAPETDGLLRETGFEPLLCEEFMTGRPHGSDTWAVMWVGRAEE